MLHPSTQQLIRTLAELTEAGALAWKQTSGEAIRLETEGYIVEVEAAPATLRLLRGDGRELERADEPDLDAVNWPDGPGTYASHISLMAQQAHRLASGAQEATTKALSSLSTPPMATPESGLAPQQPPHPVAIFGDIEGFARPAPGPPPAAPPPIAVRSISARTIQIVEQAKPSDIYKPWT